MTSAQRISLLQFLSSPRSGIARLNGWQRIWLVTTAILFLLHLGVGYALLAQLPTTQFEPATFQSRIAAAENWSRENHAGCKAAEEEVQLAKRQNAEYNVNGRTRLRELREATEAKIEEAKGHLFAIETSGGKYSQEWSKYNEAITAYTQKVSEQTWLSREFDEQAMVSAATRQRVQRCDEKAATRPFVEFEMHIARESAQRATTDATSIMMGSVISFICFALSIYGAGWCIGWIAGGFKRAA